MQRGPVRTHKLIHTSREGPWFYRETDAARKYANWLAPTTAHTPKAPATQLSNSHFGAPMMPTAAGLFRIWNKVWILAPPPPAEM